MVFAPLLAVPAAAYIVHVDVTAEPENVVFDGTTGSIRQNVTVTGWTDCPSGSHSAIVFAAFAWSPANVTIEPDRAKGMFQPVEGAVPPRAEVRFQVSVWINRTAWGREHGIDESNRWTRNVSGACVVPPDLDEMEVEGSDFTFEIRSPVVPVLQSTSTTAPLPGWLAAAALLVLGRVRRR